MSAEIAAVRLLEILDSRGQPTLQVELTLDQGTRVVAGVPSGTTTGSAEAIERRDGDQHRFAGRGLVEVAEQAGHWLTEALGGQRLNRTEDQIALDQRLHEVDSTRRFVRLGGNVAVGISVAACRAIAAVTAVPEWQVVHELTSTLGDSRSQVAPRLPVPHFTMISGAAGPSDLPFQDFMIAPLGAPSLTEAVRAGAEIYQRLRALLTAANLPVGVAEEGGFILTDARPDQALQLMVDAISEAGYEPGPHGVALALDVAASRFRFGPEYILDEQPVSSNAMIDYLEDLVERFPIWSVEDGLAENDWDGWLLLKHRLGARIQLVGDDIFVTDGDLIQRGIDRGWANAAVIKLNQVGTVSQSVTAASTCAGAGWGAMVAHRSGETTDPFIADLAVGLGCGQFKAGAPARGERVAKYNRLLEIAVTGAVADWGLPDGFRSLRTLEGFRS